MENHNFQKISKLRQQGNYTELKDTRNYSQYLRAFYVNLKDIKGKQRDSTREYKVIQEN